jgi:carbonic anhydrase
MKRIVSLLVLAVLALPAAALDAHADAHGAAKAGPTADAVLKSLQDGNARFVAGKAKHPNENLARVKDTSANGQHPGAIILGCSDSRVPPEIVFDAGIGDLFVARVAGNVAEEHTLGSIEYAAEHLGSKLIVVLGHHKCGAVKATADGAGTEGNLGALVREIQPAVAAAKAAPASKEGVVHDAIHQHARNVAAKLTAASPVLKKLVDEGAVKIAVAVYDLDSGKVDWEK